MHDTFHVSMLRRFQDNGAGARKHPMVMIEGQQECALQHTLAHKPATRAETVCQASCSVERSWSCLQRLGACTLDISTRSGNAVTRLGRS